MIPDWFGWFITLVVAAGVTWLMFGTHPHLERDEDH